MSEMPWFRIYPRMVDDERLRLLDFPDRWHFIALLCCKASGQLDLGNGRDLLRQKIARRLGLPVRELDDVVRRLAGVGLIDEDSLQPTTGECL